TRRCRPTEVPETSRLPPHRASLLAALPTAGRSNEPGTTCNRSARDPWRPSAHSLCQSRGEWRRYSAGCAEKDPHSPGAGATEPPAKPPAPSAIQNAVTPLELRRLRP